MTILAVDTTSKIATAAVVKDGALVGEITISTNLTHSQTMLPIVEQLFSLVNMTIENIDAFAVSIGPGSFTGIRIGIAAIEALAYSVNKPIIGVSTLDVLAMNVKYYQGIICPMINARNKQVYTTSFLQNIDRIRDYVGEDIYDALNSLKMDINENKKTSQFESSEKSAIIVGDGGLEYREIITEFAHEHNINIEIAPESSAHVSAKWVAILGEEMLKNGQDTSYNIEPMYLRKSQAERMREERQ